MTQDDDRLRAALVEFMEWARMNPGKSTPGAGFFSARQGETPFFDETAINRIRSDIKRYHQSDHLADSQTDETEFSARLFLALAQENDLATDRLDHDLNQFKMLEKNFLEALKDADEVGFNRQPDGRSDLAGRSGSKADRATDSGLGHPGSCRCRTAATADHHQPSGDRYAAGIPWRNYRSRKADRHVDFPSHLRARRRYWAGFWLTWPSRKP